MSTEESPSFKLVLTSTVSKFGLKSAPIPVETKELAELVILLMRDDLICSESSALTLKENPNDMVKIELINVLDTLELDIFIILIIKLKKAIVS
jgi:hypothetical protein